MALRSTRGQRDFMIASIWQVLTMAASFKRSLSFPVAAFSRLIIRLVEDSSSTRDSWTTLILPSRSANYAKIFSFYSTNSNSSAAARISDFSHRTWSSSNI
uniref:Uncharacterized protein n=1 Tax=Arundo donax TaxID=35708 RepID=A0A0A9B2Z5_ARUDO